ncbi:MAG: hypothetical protein IPM42_00165 [Saprospiraceae bacterium]|nr:hypothetical protein [Saprospiraceae bacterium]
MKPLQNLFIFIIIVNLWACKNHPSQNDDPLVASVMEIHDAVMPEMATIHSLKRQLKSLELKTAEDSASVYQQIKQLDDADEGMMSWMAEFKVPDDKAKKENYLNNEKIKIQKVSDDMISAISNAKMLLANLKKE